MADERIAALERAYEWWNTRPDYTPEAWQQLAPGLVERVQLPTPETTALINLATDESLAPIRVCGLPLLALHDAIERLKHEAANAPDA